MADIHELSAIEDPDERMLETVLGPSLVGRLFGLLRAVRIYDPSNQTVARPAPRGPGADPGDPRGRGDAGRHGPVLLRERHAGAGRALADPAVRLAVDRVRAAPSRRSALPRGTRGRRAGRVRATHGRAPRRARGALLAEAAVGAGISHVVPISLEELESAESGPGQSSEDGAAAERDRARKVFRQALHGTRAALLRTARTGRPAIRRVKRVVHPIVDSIMKNEYSIVGLTAIKSHDEYTYAHCGERQHPLDRDRPDARPGAWHARESRRRGLAPRHRQGRDTRGRSLGKPGELDSAEWDLMRRHPLEGTKLIMRMPGLPHLMLDALERRASTTTCAATGAAIRRWSAAGRRRRWRASSRSPTATTR